MPVIPETTLDYHFPKAGLHTASAYGRQPVRQGRDGVYVRTAAQGVNVRSFDPASGRDRGGSRCGQSKYVAARVPPERWVIQEVNTLVSNTGSVAAVQQNLSGRVVYLVAVSQGDVKVATPGDTAWTSTVNNSGETPPLNFTGVMQSTPLNQLLFFADGINYCYYKPPTNSVEAWVPTLGTLPRDADQNGCRLLTTWRGRAVMSGLLKDPQNWFMSRVGDPFDWEYGPAVTTVSDPVAGNNTPRLGLIGDVVTALITVTDDVLTYGGDHTIFDMRGDPADNGQIDLVTDVTGIAFGQAWCKDPQGTVYFFGSKPSIWRRSGTGKPERISNPIEPLLQDIDTGNSIIRLAWDHNEQSIRIFVTPSDPADNALGTTHYVFETRTGSFWQDTFANTDHNPLCCCEYDGNDPDDRVLLVGGWDGFVRAFDPDAVTDDSTAIASSVLLGPILTQEMDEMLLKELQWILATASGQITWEVLSAATAEAAISASARVSGTAAAGRNNTQPVRVADHAIYVKITATTRWAMESLRAKFAGRGKVRRRN